jgi:hypothetical protein
MAWRDREVRRFGRLAELKEDLAQECLVTQGDQPASGRGVDATLTQSGMFPQIVKSSYSAARVKLFLSSSGHPDGFQVNSVN